MLHLHDYFMFLNRDPKTTSNKAYSVVMLNQREGDDDYVMPQSLPLPTSIQPPTTFTTTTAGESTTVAL